METVTASNTFTGQPAEASTSTAYDEDARHYAVTASQVPKPASSSLTPPTPLSDMSPRDPRNGGTRFMEDCQENDSPRLSLRPSRLFHGKGKDSILKEREKKKPLCLLDLPIDILKEIVKEVTHTNDLTSLALCHSALHRLAIPHIYSRFDIVWPDTTTHAEPRSGVDALTYGLATLVMAEEIFRPQRSATQAMTNRFNLGGRGKATETTIRRRRGNHYAQFTRKFSLGNGPPDWVQEYLITKEGGKMLGTLVALAVARMQSLETFIWDMPTGILRDVWLALSSLGDWGDERPCRLDKVWVRWHNNSLGDVAHPIQHMPPPMNVDLMNNNPAALDQSQVVPLTQAHSVILDRVEHPSFSVLPPLRSLSVLDIDELAYLDEMSVLIGNSRHKLRELRVGIARHTITREWATVWEGDSIRQVDKERPTMGSVTIGKKRLGGILGVLMGFVCDMRQPAVNAVAEEEAARPSSHESEPLPSQPDVDSAELFEIQSSSEEFVTALDTIASIGNVLPDVATGGSHMDDSPNRPEEEIADAAPNQSTLHDEPSILPSALEHSASAGTSTARDSLTPNETAEPSILDCFERESSHLEGFLQLDTLELERVSISVPVLQKAIDWSTLTSLTLLHCQNHEQLWKTLRRTFMPTPKSPTYPQARRSLGPSPKKNRLSFGGTELEMVYGLNLKKIHTNTVSPALVTFLKETLAPNSLEVLFLQEARSYSSSVTVDTLFRGPVRRHRNSLKKLLIDSSEKGIDGLPNSSSRWRRWMPSRDNLSFVCSGKMSSLRELGMAIDYNNWHFFLQHLPSIPHLRSLYIPFLADHVHGPTADPRELALQILDIVALRPDVELCYMGIANKCFEILENKREGDSRPDSRLGTGEGGMEDPTSDAEDDEDDDDLDDVDDDVDDLDDELDETESDEDDDDMDETDSDLDDSVSSKHSARLRLREILFYDDKVAVFKARHGKL